MLRMRHSHGLTGGSHRDIKMYMGQQLETSVNNQPRVRWQARGWLVTRFSSKAGNWTRWSRNALCFAPLKQQL